MTTCTGLKNRHYKVLSFWVHKWEEKCERGIKANVWTEVLANVVTSFSTPTIGWDSTVSSPDLTINPHHPSIVYKCFYNVHICF